MNSKNTGYAIAASVNDAPVGDVRCALNSLDSNIAELNNRLNNLAALLIPVMSPEPNVESLSKSPPRVAAANQVSSRIYDQCDVIDSFNYRVQELIERLSI
jgi:hypothetical protein